MTSIECPNLEAAMFCEITSATVANMIETI